MKVNYQRERTVAAWITGMFTSTAIQSLAIKCWPILILSTVAAIAFGCLALVDIKE